MSGYKVRLSDGSEIGPMDLEALKTWHLQGLVDGDSPVMRSGSRSWVPLGTLPEFRGATRKQPPRSRKDKARVSGAPGADVRAEPTRVGLWRVRAVALVLVAVAAGLGLVAWRPDTVRPAFDGAPWWQMALGTLALALTVLPGWQVGRRLARIVLVVAAFLLFPVAGILIAQGERGPALLALASAWVLVSGLAAVLARSLGSVGLVLALLPVVAGVSGVIRFGRAPESAEAQLVHSWSRPERELRDDDVGLSLDLPEGWVALRPGNPLVAAPEGALFTLAQPRLGGLGYVLAEPAPLGVATPDQYLDHLMARRRATHPDLAEQGRANAILGELAGRRLDSRWRSGATPQQDLTVTGQDGWMSFALVAWMPEATASRPAGLEPLAGALTIRGLLAPRLRAAVEAAVDQVPHMTPRAAALLMAQSEARVLEPDQAFRRSVVALAALLPSLTPAQTQELSVLTRATYAGVPRRRRDGLARYIEAVRRGDTTDPALDREMAALMKEAELSLPPAQRQRLQEYYEHAVEQRSSAAQSPAPRDAV
jgi:hypothetical protein